jgi:hypothetical protein
VGQSAAALGPGDAGDSGDSSHRPGPPPTVGTLDAQTNWPIDLTGHHEQMVAVAYHDGGDPVGFDVQPGWVIVIEPRGDNLYVSGWGYSDDLDATTWHVFLDAGIDAYGNPCDAPANPCMANGGKFAGSSGDPYIATVTDPSINGSPDGSTVGVQVLYTQLANGTAVGGVFGQGTDVMVSLSTNGGESFGHSQLLTIGISGDGGTGSPGSPNASGPHADNPVIASHLASPYSTFATWDVITTTDGGASAPWVFSGAYIARVSYDSTFHLQTRTPFSDQQIPPGSGSGNIYHPTIDIGQVVACNGATDEIVYVAWADDVAGVGCNKTTPPFPVYNVTWWYAVYDADAHVWYGPWEVDNDPTWPGCVGSPIDAGLFAENDVRPRLAAEPEAHLFWVAYIHSTANVGTQIKIAPEEIGCSCGTPPCDGGLVPILGGSPVTSAPHCYNQLGCPPLQDGGWGPNNSNGSGYTVNDEWGPAIAFQKNFNTGERELLATWYDTRGDNSNKAVAIWGFYDVEHDINISNLESNQFQVSNGTGVPWNHTLAEWLDYQALAAEPLTYTFLGAWAGDARNTSDAGIWSAVIR